MSDARFTGGVNIAMKIPRAEYEATVSFYREALGLDVTEEPDTGSPSISRSHSLSFGPNKLWLDCVDGHARSDVWLEVVTDDLDAATNRLSEAGTEPCDEIEPFTDPEMSAHWIKNPAGVVHLLVERRAE